VIRPTPSELLGRIADALMETVLPELDDDAARIQLQVAALIVRRLAGPAGDVGPYLDADNRDMATALAAWFSSLGLDPATRPTVDAALAAPPVPAVTTLVDRNVALQAILVDAERAMRALPDGDRRDRLDAELRALLDRMLTRDAEIHTTYSGW
jgi:hypothetical protein